MSIPSPQKFKKKQKLVWIIVQFYTIDLPFKTTAQISSIHHLDLQKCMGRMGIQGVSEKDKSVMTYKTYIWKEVSPLHKEAHCVILLTVFKTLITLVLVFALTTFFFFSFQIPR